MDLVCLGKIVKSHGVRGGLKVESYTENPLSLVGYSPLFLGETNNQVQISLSSSKGNFLICNIADIDNRDKADALRGSKIYTYRDSLDLIEDEDDFYISDLIGLNVKSNNEIIGIIDDVRDYGAGSIILIKFTDSNKSEMFSFTKETFPLVDISGGFVTFNPLEIIEGD